MSFPGPIDRLLNRLTTAWHDRAIVLKAASFAMVGVVNTLVDATVFFLAYAFLTKSLVLANMLSWSVGVTCSYVLNSFITFAHESGRSLTLRGYAAFVASGVVGLVGNTATLVIAAEVLPVWAAKACAILVSFMINFSMSHFIVFRKRPQASGQ